MNEIIIAVVIGVVAGLLGGTLGIGGAVVIIPALVWFLGYSQQQAQGTTLFMLVWPVGALAAWQYYKAGMVQVKVALILAVTFFIASFIGARFATHVPGVALKKAFAVLLIIIAVKTLFIDK
ncbi:MAG: sulfite exporter TauE/SafE family protein [Chitinophagales bacterium]